MQKRTGKPVPDKALGRFSARREPLPSAADIAARTRTDGRAPAVKIADLEAANASLCKRLSESQNRETRLKTAARLSRVTIDTLAAEVERLNDRMPDWLVDDLPF